MEVGLQVQGRGSLAGVITSKCTRNSSSGPCIQTQSRNFVFIVALLERFIYISNIVLLFLCAAIERERKRDSELLCVYVCVCLLWVKHTFRKKENYDNHYTPSSS